MNEDLLYDFAETDPRFRAELLVPCPQLSPTTAVYFDGLSWDERGIVLRCSDGDNQHPRSFTLQVVFPCSVTGLRTFAMTAHQENKLCQLAELAGTARHAGRPLPFYRCRFSRKSLPVLYREVQKKRPLTPDFSPKNED